MIKDYNRDVTGILAAMVDMECNIILERGSPIEAVEIIISLLKLPPQESINKRYALLELLRQVPVENEQISEDKAEIASMAAYDWDGPGMALFRDGNPKELAHLMRQQIPVPTEVTRILGVMLDPPKGYRGYELEVKLDRRKGHWKQSAENLRTQSDAAKRYKELRKDCSINHKRAVTILIKEFDRQKSWVEEAIKMDQGKIYLLTQKFLGFMDREYDH